MGEIIMNNQLKKLVAICFGIIFTLTLVGCGNKVVKESLEKANTAMKNKEYDKVLVLLELALDEDKDNKEAKEMYSIVEEYKNIKGLIDENAWKEASEAISKINDAYVNYPIKEDIELLQVQIDEKMQEVKAVEEKITVLKYLVEEKKYDEAKALIEGIKENLILKEQINTVQELQDKVDTEIAIADAAKKAEEERLAEEARLEEERKKAEEASKNVITAQKANELVRNYLANNGSYIPGTIQVDSENDEEYIVHAFDNMGTHTATTGWYYVNKITGEITSMF